MARPSPSEHANEFKWKKLKGNDKYWYVSRPDKNGVYHWHKIVSKKTIREYYKQFVPAKEMVEKYSAVKFMDAYKDAKKEFEKHDIFLIYVKWSDAKDFVDDAYDVALETVAGKFGVSVDDVEDKYSFLFFTEHDLYWACVKNGFVTIGHKILDKDFEVSKKILNKYFKKGKGYVYAKYMRIE